MSACQEVPIVMRATTFEYVTSSTRQLAAYAASTQKVDVFVVGCWSGTLNLSGAVGIGLQHHPACNATWRHMTLGNPQARARLAASPLQPIWGAVELLTAAALELPAVLPRCRPTHLSPRRGPGCTAFIIDPDVLLPTVGTVQATCQYYDATRYDAVLMFAAPSALYRSVSEAVARESIPALMGNRHVGFLSSLAQSTLAQLTRSILPTYDFDKCAEPPNPSRTPAEPQPNPLAKPCSHSSHL